MQQDWGTALLIQSSRLQEMMFTGPHPQPASFTNT